MVQDEISRPTLTPIAIQPFTSQPAQSFVFWLKAHNKKGQPPVYTIAQIVCLSHFAQDTGIYSSLTEYSEFRMNILP